MGIHALTRFKLSNMNCRSTARSRTMGNFDIGSSRIGCSNLSTNAEQAMRALPLMSIAHEPQTVSRQLESYETGVVFLPSRVTGFPAMSRKQMIAFIAGRQVNANSSQYGAPCGLTCRLIFTMTCFSAISPLLIPVALSWPQRDPFFGACLETEFASQPSVRKPTGKAARIH